MFTTVKIYKHGGNMEIFHAEVPAQINLPECKGNLEPHLDLQVGQLSFHIKLSDLYSLLSNEIQFRIFREI